MVRVSFNRLVGIAFAGYVAYAVHELYTFCRPPVATGGGGVVWDLRDFPPLDVHVFLADTDVAPQQLPPPRSPSGTEYVLLGEFGAVQAGHSSNVPDVQVAPRPLPRAFHQNVSLYLHVLAAPRGGAPIRTETTRISRFVVPVESRVRTRYLLAEPLAPSTPTGPPPRPVSSLPRVVEVGFVQELQPLDLQGLQERGLGGFVEANAVRLPLYINTLVSPRDEYVALTEPSAVPEAALSASQPGVDGFQGMTLRFRNIGLGYWNLQLQLSFAFDDAEKTMGFNEYDVDSFKQMIGGSSPWKVVLVYAIALLHIVFEYLAVSSDIKFWRHRASFDGVSSSSVALQAVTNVIMLMYVHEQQKTRFVLYMLAGRLCLQLWKLHKLTALERCTGWPFLRWVNRPGAIGGLEEMQDTHEAERRCMRWLLILLLPAMLAFCIYRLIWHKFRSWYSWFVLSLAVCAQMGGFVVMTPQVFMNYRLKSVDHLPWAALTYQAINTFIDDVFVLCIRMPEVQKFSAFRDDIVFFICLYQRWLYRGRDRKVADADKHKDL